MKLNTNAAAAIGVVRGIITQDPMAVIEAHDGLWAAAAPMGPPTSLWSKPATIIGELRALR